MLGLLAGLSGFGFKFPSFDLRFGRLSPPAQFAFQRHGVRHFEVAPVVDLAMGFLVLVQHPLAPRDSVIADRKRDSDSFFRAGLLALDCVFDLGAEAKAHRPVTF